MPFRLACPGHSKPIYEDSDHVMERLFPSLPRRETAVFSVQDQGRITCIVAGHGPERHFHIKIKHKGHFEH